MWRLKESSWGEEMCFLLAPQNDKSSPGYTAVWTLKWGTTSSAYSIKKSAKVSSNLWFV